MTTKSPILSNLKSVQLRTDLPAFRSGDKVVVRSKIKEGEKERIQAFEGTIIAINNTGIRQNITVRKVSAGVGVERVYPVNSPSIESIEVKNQGFVRRAKLYYLRELQGRSARIQDKKLKISEAQGAAAANVAAKS